MAKRATTGLDLQLASWLMRNDVGLFMRQVTSAPMNGPG
jgi:hypothetical protein